MIKNEITFDRFVRGGLTVAVIVAVVLLLRYLSGVLIPFFIACLAAYMLHPIVIFLQEKCRLRNRLLSVLLTFVLVGGTLGGLIYLSIPPFMEECAHLKSVALQYIERGGENSSVPQALRRVFDDGVNHLQLDRLLREGDLPQTIKTALPKVWEFLWSAASVVVNLIVSLIALLYLFFLLMDYDKLQTKWLDFVPSHRRHFAATLMSDIEEGMSGYFRGQMLIALSNCVMFSIGFLLIGFPAPIGLGVFIGLISFVPYLQVLGMLPALVLALLHAIETGDNFWWLIGGVVLVYIVVQIIQDVVVTPHVMGKIMHLSPLVILLSLSVWGYMLGIIGLIIALPVTTLMLSYYRRYIVEQQRE